MPAADNYIIGAIADIYVGTVSGIEMLEWMDTPRTQGGKFIYQKPDNWEQANSDLNQTDLCSVEATLTFFWSTQAYRISMQNPLTTANLDDPPSGAHYCVLCLAPDPYSEASFLLPNVVSVCKAENNFLKTTPTDIVVTFIRKERNKMMQIARRGTYATLAAILGTRSPI